MMTVDWQSRVSIYSHPPFDTTKALPSLHHSAQFQSGGNPNGKDVYANGTGSQFTPLILGAPASGSITANSETLVKDPLLR